MWEKDSYFDFETKNELPEDLDFSRTKACPHCNKPIPQDALMCLYCGESINLGREKPTWIIWVSLLVIISFLSLILLR